MLAKREQQQVSRKKNRNLMYDAIFRRILKLIFINENYVLQTI